jgi:hypothetical protein
MKWINASERLPENKKWNYIFRQARNSRSARVVYLDHAPNISAYMQLPIDNIEWLDESPDEKDKEIERLKGLIEQQVILIAMHEGDMSKAAQQKSWNEFKAKFNL